MALRPSPLRIAWATHSELMTGNMPGMAASTSETWLFGSPPNSVEAPEKSLDLETTWAWTSKPITTSQSPVAPLMSLDGDVWVFMACSFVCPRDNLYGVSTSELSQMAWCAVS